MPVLSFKGKTAVENHHHVVPHHSLEVDRELSVLGKGEEPSLLGNVIIEGDNLAALKSLLPTHAGKVKCVYIDPPYNTGNEGWVYNDNLTQPQFKEWIGKVVGNEAEDACRHDKWCCMMYPRLQLLRELLRDDGAIFISIDDNEVHHLRMMMDEIFGSENHVATFVWQKRYSRDNRPAVGTVHEYIVTYSKVEGRFAEVRNKLRPSDESTAVYRNPNKDPQGRWRPIPMTAQGRRKNQMYAIRTPAGVIHHPPEGRCWSILEDEYEKLLAAKRIWFGKDQRGQPNIIRYLSEVEGFVPWTWLPHEEVGHTDEAKKELFDFFAKDDVFDSPKPTRLVRRLLEIYTSSDGEDIVLDSFAGSGTTGHAVLTLNSEDDGDRRFILIQMPHDTKEHESRGLNICEKITAERIRRVITGYSTGDGEQTNDVAGLGGTFTYARVGRPLVGEHGTWGEQLPTFEDLARYIFFTETGRDLDFRAIDMNSGRIGEHNGVSYYLLYTAERDKSLALDADFQQLAKKDKNKKKVVYCEKLWLHREDLQRLRDSVGEVRPMLLPFQIKK